MSTATGACTAWALVAAVLLLRRWRRRHRAGLPFLPPRPAMRRRTALALVLGVAATVTFLPIALSSGAAAAYADGWDCKEAPAPETGNAWGDFVDSDAETAARGDGSNYGTYGWGGLRWATYDLGCGPDVTRAPGAVFDTSAGNFGLNLSKAMAGTAIWLDRQTRTEYEHGGGASSVLTSFDRLVTSGSAALKSAFYDEWITVALLLVGIIVLASALRGRSAQVMRATLVGAAALFLAALAIGAPQKATQAMDQQFTGAIGDVQGNALSKMGVNPDTGPRDVVINDIIERAWLTGWFGDPDSPIAAKDAAKLRAALALSYNDRDELTRIKAERDSAGIYPPGSPFAWFAAYHKVVQPKKDAFVAIANEMHTDSADSYGQFIGKDSGRMNTGFIAALSTFSATALWIAASLLKLLGLLIIRLAILFAPIWIPLAMISESLLMTIVRFIGSALFWAVAASAAVAAHLIVLTKLFDPALGLSNGWRVFMLIIVTAVIWMVLRPFKRISQFAGMNVNATARGALARARRGSTVAAGVAGGAIGASAGWLAGQARRRSSDEGYDPAVPVVAQEGTLRRQHPTPPAQPPAITTVERPALPGAPSPAGAEPIPIPPTLPPPRAEIAPTRTTIADEIIPIDQPTPPLRPVTPIERDGELVYDLYTPSTDLYTRQTRADSQPGLDREPDLVGVS